jgi:hypothetical protein
VNSLHRSKLLRSLVKGNNAAILWHFQALIKTPKVQKSIYRRSLFSTMFGIYTSGGASVSSAQSFCEFSAPYFAAQDGYFSLF